MFNSIYFEHPSFLALFFLFVFCNIYCKAKPLAIYFPHIKKFITTQSVTSKVLPFLKWLAILMLVISFASPIKENVYDMEPKNGHEIALILDSSESMRNRGFDNLDPTLTRFDVVKEIVGDFISKRENDNIGLVVFGAYSFIASPLTYDKEILKKILSNFYIGMAGKYTALYESLAQGVNLLKMSKSKSKVMILLTDGYNTPGGRFSLDVVMDMIKKEGIKVYPIGIGPRGGYNKAILVKIAKESGGVAFGASNALELHRVYKQIDELEKSKIKSKKFVQLQYYYQYPLFIALFALILFVYLRNKGGEI